LAKPATGALQQRGQDPDQPEQARGDVGYRHAGLGGCIQPGQSHQPSFGLQDLVVADSGPVRAERTEPADRQTDKGGVEFAQNVCGQAESIHHAGAEVLDRHIGSPQQRLQGVEVLARSQVQNDAAFVAVGR
jgi:hypothetical protein